MEIHGACISVHEKHKFVSRCLRFLFVVYVFARSKLDDRVFACLLAFFSQSEDELMTDGRTIGCDYSVCQLPC